MRFLSLGQILLHLIGAIYAALRDLFVPVIGIIIGRIVVDSLVPVVLAVALTASTEILVIAGQDFQL